MVCGLPRMREQLRDRRTVDIGIEHADLEAEVAQPERQVDRRGGFADAALAGGDRDNGLHARHPGLLACLRRSRLTRRRRGASGRRSRHGATGRRWRGPRAGRAFAGERHHCGDDAGHGADRHLGGLAHRLPGRHQARIDGDREEHLAVGHDHVRELAGRRQRDALGTLHRREGRENCVLVDCHTHAPP